MEKQKNNFITKNKYPTLHVKDFGKIKEAEIELAPFTLFIGDNNSGKSYLLNLIWGLQKEFSKQASFFSIVKYEQIEEEVAYIDLVTKLKSTRDFPITKEEKSKKIDFDRTDINNIMILINEVLKKNKNYLIQHLFNSNNVSLNEVSLFLPEGPHMEFTSSIEKYIDKTSIAETKQGELSLEDQYILWISFSINKRVTTRGVYINNNKIPFKSIINIIMRHVLKELFPYVIEPKPTESNNPVFFPTSRTGFLLVYKELAKNSISKNYEMTISDDDNLIGSGGIKLLQSTILFTHMLLNLDSKHDTAQVKNLIEYVEKEVIHGKLEMHPETGEFLYTPEGSEIELEMHMTSAVVTELAPLILYLKYHALTGVVFMEEPEISLHPELQEKITRVLIKLIKHATNQQVFIATHSDTITQHINNMIKLHNNQKNRQTELLKEFDYDENDMINQDKVRMYQFDIDNKTYETKITKLESSKIGFTTDTFNDFLYSVADQTESASKDLEL